VKELADSAPPPRNVAMNWLARREHSLAELRTKLAARGYSPQEIEISLKALVAEGLVSDERFAESFVAARMRKGQGPVRIRMELQKRGVAAETIHLHVDDSALDWHTLAREVRRKKFGMAKPFEYKEKARQMRFLEYRGFTGEQISKAVDDL
jgi:regulatory protein